jgi:hypothetical protein
VTYTVEREKVLCDYADEKGEESVVGCGNSAFCD